MNTNTNEATLATNRLQIPCPQDPRGRAMLELPEAEPWPDPVDGKLLLDGISQVLTRFAVLPKWAPETLALFTLHTYAFQLRHVSTYVGIESPEKRCGKTTLLTILSELVNRPLMAANISSPAFFRVIEETQPTLLIDEADTFLQGNDELRGILNSGYTRKAAYVVRVASEPRNARPEPRGTNGNGSAHGSQSGEEAEAVRSTGSRLVKFSCWCPKVIATIGRLPDTVADRCIVIRMQRKTAREECERLRNLEVTALRRQCARFVLDHSSAIAQARADIPPGLNDRAGDIWEPLLVLADLAGGAWPEEARQAAVGLNASAQESSPIGALLMDILICYIKAGGERIFSRDLVERLNGFEDRPWTEVLRGKEITELRLAQQLRPYGLRPRNLSIDKVQAKGYLKADFTEIFRRYIPQSEIDALREELARPVERPEQKAA